MSPDIWDQYREANLRAAEQAKERANVRAALNFIRSSYQPATAHRAPSFPARGWRWARTWRPW